MWKEKFEQEGACFFECIIFKYFSEVFICLARPFAVKNFIKPSMIKNTYFYSSNSSKELKLLQILRMVVIQILQCTDCLCRCCVNHH